MDRESIFARVVIEERFAVVSHARGLSLRDTADLAAKSPADGGIGSRMAPSVVRDRLVSYRRQIAARRRQAREWEAERREWIVDDEIRRASADMAVAAFDSPAYRAADRRLARWEREERRLHRLAEFEDVPVPLPLTTREIIEAVDVDIEIDVAEAVARMPAEDQPYLRRTLQLRVRV